MRDYTDEKIREEIALEKNTLMKEAEQKIFQGNGAGLYDSSTHYYVNEEGWEIMHPLKKELWWDTFNRVQVDKELPWPQYSAYSYTMSVLCPPFIHDSLLFFGYAVLDKKLIKTAFFAVETIVDYQLMPQAMVIDPMAIANGIEPEYYFGCTLSKEDISNFLTSRGREHPLEVFVREKNRKDHERKMHDSYMESYYIQKQYEPGWFPQELIDFCEKEGLPIPPQQRTDTRIGCKVDKKPVMEVEEEDEDEEPVISYRVDNNESSENGEDLDIFNDPKDEQAPQSIILKLSDKRDDVHRPSRKIFLLRHGAYMSGPNHDQPLSLEGKKQARNLALKIRSNLRGKDSDITIWTSTANRAQETSQIINQELNAKNFIEFEKLWSDGITDSGHKQDFQWLESEIDNFNGEVLIIISHLEYVQRFPEVFGFPENEAEYAQGVLIEDSRCINFG